MTNHTEINTYWIKFKSGKEETSKGFLAEYSYITHNDLGGSEGVITTPLYPRQFLGDETLTYRITVQMGSVVLIKFEQLRFSSKLHGICIATIRVSKNLFSVGNITIYSTRNYLVKKIIYDRLNLVNFYLYLFVLFIH